MSLFNLENRVALVTGASSGLGRRFSQVLASQGAKVVVAARRMDRLQELAKEIEATGAACLPIQCDVTCEQDIVRMVGTTKEHFGSIDILVNNAGAVFNADAVSVSAADYDKVMDVNSRAVFFVAREAAKVMIEANYGRIINIASMYGMVGNKFSALASYHTSKGSVISMTRALAAEWASKGITVNALCPGFFASELTKAFLEKAEFMTFVKNSCCLERLGKPGELDTALVFLAAEKTSYMTGQTLVIDGGWTCI